MGGTEDARSAQGVTVSDCSSSPPSPPSCHGQTAGQKMIWVHDCHGTGCNANGLDADCAWCVYDMNACTQAYGATCSETDGAKAAQGFDGCSASSSTILAI